MDKSPLPPVAQAPLTHTYGADGLRRSTQGPGMQGTMKARYLWDGENALIVSRSAPGIWPEETHYTDYPGVWGGLASQSVNYQGQNTSTFYGADLQANTGITVTPAGSATQYLYTAFGEKLRGGSVRFQFGGQVGYQIPEPGLVQDPGLYVRARYLDTALGRWLSRDPLGFDEGPNPYLYVGNGPVSAVDPSGLGWEGWEEIAAAVATALGLWQIEFLALRVWPGRPWFMRATQRQLRKKGRLAEKMWLRAAKVTPVEPGSEGPTLRVTPANQGQWCSVVDKIRASAAYKKKVELIKRRLREGSAPWGYVNIEFDEASGTSQELHYSIHGAQLHYRATSGAVELTIVDYYNFDWKHIWRRLQEEGHIQPYRVRITMPKERRQ